MGARGLYRNLKARAPELIEQLPQMPQLLADALQQLKQLDELQQKDVERRQAEHDRASRRWQIDWGAGRRYRCVVGCNLECRLATAGGVGGSAATKLVIGGLGCIAIEYGTQRLTRSHVGSLAGTDQVDR